MENLQEPIIMFRIYKLQALSEMIEEYAYKNRAKIVQRLLVLKHQIEKNLELNKPLQAQYGSQNEVISGLPLVAISHIKNNDKEVKNEI